MNFTHHTIFYNYKMKIRNILRLPISEQKKYAWYSLSLLSNQDSFSRVFFWFLPTHYAAGLSWCIQVACEENPSRLEKLTARREGSKWAVGSIYRFVDSFFSASVSCLLDGKTRHHLRQARRLFWVLFQPLDRLHRRVKKRRQSNEQFIIARVRIEFLQYQKYRTTVGLQNWWC